MEGRGFRDEFQHFQDRGINIIGMSADPPGKQKKFHTKYGFPYPLLCDEGHEVLEAYGAWGPKKLYGRNYMGIARISYLINEAGEVVKVYPKVKPISHPKQVLADWEALG